jgi:inorganic pyrophosphatase
MDYRKAAQDLATYIEAADSWERKADKLQGAQRAEALRKAMVYRGNARAIHTAAGELLKAFPISKRVDWKGMKVSIENPAGSFRKWKDAGTGAEGQTHMLNDYGYLRQTGAADGDAVDVFMGPDPDGAQHVYVVRQLRAPDFRYYDEDKCMIGFHNADHARAVYHQHYNSPRFFGGMDTYPVDTFLQAVKGTHKAPAPVGGWNALMVPQRMSDHPLLNDEASVFIAEAEKPLDNEEAAMPAFVRPAAILPDNAEVIHKAILGALDIIKGEPVRKKVKWQGVKISIEAPAGTVRMHEDEHGVEKETYMYNDYGYFNKTKGADGDCVDVFLGPDLEHAHEVYVVRQLVAPECKYYDEDKCMVGFDSEDKAKEAYLKHHHHKPKHIGQIDTYPVDTFVDDLKKTRETMQPVGGWDAISKLKLDDKHRGAASDED